MDISRLEEFCVLAQSASFKTAADTLGISPALLSNHIALLEKRLGTALFKRSAHNFELTEDGKRFLVDAKELCSDYGQLLSNMGSIHETESPYIRIGFSGFIIPSKLGPYLDIINYRHPNIRIELFDERTHNIEDGIGSGELDIFMSYAPNDLRFPGIERELVYRTKVLALVALNHHLAHKSSLSLSDLEGERFVLYPKGADSAYREAELEMLENSGISYSLYDGHVSPSAHFILVSVGKGIALCPRMMRTVIPPNTVAIPVIDSNFECSMYMFYKKDNQNPYLSEFLEGFRNYGPGG